MVTFVEIARLVVMEYSKILTVLGCSNRKILIDSALKIAKFSFCVAL